MKKTELIFNLISIPVDALMLLLAGISAFYFREHSLNLVGPIKYQLDFAQFLMLAYKVLPALLVIFGFLGLYNLKGARKFLGELNRVIVGASLGLLFVILIFFFNQNFSQNIFPSRFIILASWGFGIVFVMLGRFGLKLIQRVLFLKGYGLHKLVIIGGGNMAIIEQIYRKKNHGYEITGEYAYSDDVFKKLESLYSKKQVDEILQADSSLSEEINLKLVQFARGKGLKFSFVPNLFEVQRNIVETDNLNGVPIISLKNTPLDGWGKVIKRILDIIISLICLIITSPLFFLIALAIKFDSSGKVIYVAARGGSEKDFKFYKFRSMYSHLSVGDEYGGEKAEQIRRQLWEKNDRGGKDSPFLKIKHDPRVTKVGRFLRKTKLDELPQFWNVLKGDMSMVGPRAHVLDEVGKYRDRYSRMFSIKPGTFGMAQIAQVSLPNLPFEEEIRLNTYYIENWSVWLDIKILAKSFYLLFFDHKPTDDY